MDFLSETEFMEGYSKKAYHIALGRLIINSNSLKTDSGYSDDDENVRGTHLMQETAERATGSMKPKWRDCEKQKPHHLHLFQNLRDVRAQHNAPEKEGFSFA